jgi:L-rhamnose mutarotase
MARDKANETHTTTVATPATSATQTANEWGIPDWRTAESYGDISIWSFFQWRWEFYRRREDLRGIFDAYAGSSYRRWQSYAIAKFRSPEGLHWHLHCKKLGYTPELMKIEDPGFTVFINSEFKQLFGYFELPNPRISEQPTIIILPLGDEGTVKVFDGKERVKLSQVIELFTSKTYYKDIVLKAILGKCLVDLDENEICIGFDINRPLEPQLKVAAANLKRVQFERHGKRLQKRSHPKRWFGYLRALDGRESGATWAEMAELFHSQGLLGRHKNPHGGYSPPPPQVARDLWEAANTLRSNF